MGRNYKTRLKGFTILELLIALAISAIVIAAGYTVLQLSSELFIINSVNKSKKSAVIRYNYLLRKNFFESQLIYLEDDVLQFIEGDSVVVSYHFTPDRVIRNQMEIKDTFQLENIDYDFGFDGNMISLGYVDSLSITFVQSEEQGINLCKEYTAQSLLAIKNVEP